MYRLDWIEQLKLRLAPTPDARGVLKVSPVVWKLGFTSLLTDVSAEMMNSALPVYLVLFLHLSPVQYGVIDGLYNGLAVALLSVVAGITADRLGRHKEVAAAGYGLSALCKLMLLAAGGAWGWIAAIVGLERVGKGIRSAPRDAIISFHTPPSMLASAFAVHRGLDAGGSLIGPVAAFILLAQFPNNYHLLWLTSFVFGVLGCAVLTLFVPGSRLAASATAGAQIAVPSAAEPPESVWGTARETFAQLRRPQFGTIALCALALATATVSDGFIYIVLQQRTGTNASYIPLFYVGTACFYMIFSIPAGVIADRVGRRLVLMSGYAVLGAVYLSLVFMPPAGWIGTIACLALMGVYYASTEGILMALTSAVAPVHLRTSALALVSTAIGIGKLFSSAIFGWIWSSLGQRVAIVAYLAALAVVIATASVMIGRIIREQSLVRKP